MSLAERMLGGALPEAERLLLKARLNAVPSLFKVERIERGKSFTVLDVLFGGETVVHDKAMSETATANMGLAARVFPAGSFHFASPLGPPLAPLELDGALEFLQHLGMEFTREGTKGKSHLFGRLWAWADECRAGGFRPRIKNTDGDEMRFHTATYAVSDEAEARAALSARGDIRQEEEGRYTWFRVNEPGSSIMPGDTTILGTLSFVGDELLVEVNSGRRLKKARVWLDRIPGVEFRGVRVRTLEQVREEGTPPDDRLGRREVPVTPELVAYVRALTHRQYMQWLDTPLPMLGGKTPRETCRTAEGKRRIARLIRTIPKPTGPGGADVDIPRKQMFDALGLTEGE